jgi:hypothetical protein
VIPGFENIIQISTGHKYLTALRSDGKVLVIEFDRPGVRSQPETVGLRENDIYRATVIPNLDNVLEIVLMSGRLYAVTEKGIFLVNGDKRLLLIE